MDTYMHKTMVSIASLEKIEFMLSEARLKFLKKMIFLAPETAILGPQFCRILVLWPHFWWSGGSPWIRPWKCEHLPLTCTYTFGVCCESVNSSVTNAAYALCFMNIAAPLFVGTATNEGLKGRVRTIQNLHYLVMKNTTKEMLLINNERCASVNNIYQNEMTSDHPVHISSNRISSSSV